MVVTCSRDDLRAGRADWIANPSCRDFSWSQGFDIFLLLIEGATVEGQTRLIHDFLREARRADDEDRDF